MGLFSFFSRFGLAKGQKGLNAIKSKMIESDLDTAGKVEIDKAWDDYQKSSANLTSATRKLTAMRADLDRKTADYEQRLQALTLIKTKRDAATDDATKAELDKSYTALYGELSGDKTRIQGLQKQVAAQSDFVGRYQTLHKEASDRMNSIQISLTDAKQRIAFAQQREQQQKQLLDAERQANGLGGDNGDSVLSTMTSIADKAEERADAMQTSREGIAPATARDANIQTALKEVRGETSNTEDLGALKL